MTRADLISAVLEGLDREDLNSSKQPGLWVRQSEQRINKDMRAREMIRRQSRPIFGSSITLPGDFLEMTSARLAPNGVSLEYVPHFQFSDLVSGPVPSSSTPQKYTMIGQDLIIWPAGTGSVKTGSDTFLELAYYARLPPLLNDTDTNWLLETNFDVYYSAMMAYGYRFLQEMDSANNMESALSANIAVLNATADTTVSRGSRLVVKTRNPVGRTRR